jgi:thiaminase
VRDKAQGYQAPTSRLLLVTPTGAKPHPYSHWIRTYSAPAYLRMPAVKERIIDQLGAGVPYGRVQLLRCLDMSSSRRVAARGCLGPISTQQTDLRQ